MAEVMIGSRPVGGGHPCFVIAEAGSNHDGKFEQAIQLIDVAASAGADAVKFQVFRASKLYPRGAGVSDYLGGATPIYDLVARLEMSYEWLPQLAAHCRDRGILFMASAFDEESVDRLDPYVEAFKIASYEMTHIPLVRHVAERGKPTIISTGTATLEEVAETVRDFRGTGNGGLMLMQCTAAYPAPLGALNVGAILTMKVRFDVPVGLSDHSRDPLVGPLVAVGVGASLIEKHFTLSNELSGPDHLFALEPPELEHMVRAIRDAEAALGSAEKTTHPVEEELRGFARRSVFAIRDIAKGEPFSRQNIAVLRCGKLVPGLEPRRFDELLGRKTTRNIKAGQAILLGDYR